MQPRKLCWIVGSVMPIFDFSFFGSIVAKKFEKTDLLANLNKLEQISFFPNEYAANCYARSQRIVIPEADLSSNFTQKRLFAPVIMVDIEDETLLSKIKLSETNKFIEYKNYDNLMSNFCKLSVQEPNKEYISKHEIKLSSISKNEIDFSKITFRSVSFPDSPFADQDLIPEQPRRSYCNIV